MSGQPDAMNHWTDPSPCQPARGIFLVSLTYFHANPYADTSTALNADYRMARQRACMNGEIPWLSKTAADYPPTNTDDALWGCIGQWSGGDFDANNVHVQRVKQVLVDKPYPH
jgi:hypothetical protein